MSKKSKLIIIIISLIILTRISFSFTPETAIRYKLLVMGHPLQAFTTEMSFEKTQKLDKSIMYKFYEPPRDTATQSDLYNWKVDTFGPFHIAEYYGNAGFFN